MTSVTVSFSGSTDTTQVFVDDVLVLTGPGTVSRPVEPGENSLSWFVRGAPGSSYEIKITDPKSAAFSHQATVDASTKDAGIHWFLV